jgi:hypothetical protein
MTDLHLIDNSRARCFCDIGCGCHYVAVVAVDVDGHEHLVLAERASIGHPDVTYDPTTSQAEHEQDGPLPARWRDRITLAPLRCSRRTARGGRCRTIVHQPGMSCWRHRVSAE